MEVIGQSSTLLLTATIIATITPQPVGALQSNDYTGPWKRAFSRDYSGEQQ